MYDMKKRFSFTDHLSTGAAAGIVAGMLVAIWESLTVIFSSGDIVEIWLIPYGVILYAIITGIVGFFVGIGGYIIDKLLKINPKRSAGFIIYFAFMFMLPSLVVARYRYFQIILNDARPLGILDYLIILIVFSLFTIIVLLIWKMLSSVGVFRMMAGFWGAIVWFAGVAVIALVVAGIYGTRTVTPPEKQALAENLEGNNVIMIIIDTLRNDRLSINGYDKIETPNFDSFAADAINYTNHIAQSSWTKPQIATILNGMYPSSHRAQSKADVMPDGVVTIAEVYQDKGYYTIGFADNVNLSESFNFHQGFDEYYFLKPDYHFYATESAFKLSLYATLRAVHETFFSDEIWPQHFYQPAEVVNKEALRWLDGNRNKRFFMMLHYMDPHDPFFKHSEIGPNSFTGVGYARAANQNPPGDVAETYSDAYDEDILYNDYMLGEVIRYLKDNDLYYNSHIIVTADHGEEFYEHGGWWHGYTLYDEGIRVPLMIKPASDIPFEPYTDTTMVRSIDIAPTTLALSGIDIPESWHGENLFARAEEPEWIFSEEDLAGHILRSIRSREWKYIRANPTNPRGLEPQELYNMVEDPGEFNNLAPAMPEKAAELDKILQDFELIAQGKAVDQQETELDEATIQRLKALGYIK